MARAEKHTDEESFLLLANYYDQALYEARQDFLPMAEYVMDRIHTLPDALGADLATLIASCRTLAAMAIRVEDKAGRLTKFNMGNGTNYVRLKDAGVDWHSLREQALWILRAGAQFSNEFRAFVGVPAADYSHNLNEFQDHTAERAPAPSDNC